MLKTPTPKLQDKRKLQDDENDLNGHLSHATSTAKLSISSFGSKPPQVVKTLSQYKINCNKRRRSVSITKLEKLNIQMVSKLSQVTHELNIKKIKTNDVRKLK